MTDLAFLFCVFVFVVAVLPVLVWGGLLFAVMLIGWCAVAYRRVLGDVR